MVQAIILSEFRYVGQLISSALSGMERMKPLPYAPCQRVPWWTTPPPYLVHLANVCSLLDHTPLYLCILPVCVPRWTTPPPYLVHLASVLRVHQPLEVAHAQLFKPEHHQISQHCSRGRE